eukprot:6457910-Amphidinium_carterae.1
MVEMRMDDLPRHWRVQRQVVGRQRREVTRARVKKFANGVATQACSNLALQKARRVKSSSAPLLDQTSRLARYLGRGWDVSNQLKALTMHDHSGLVKSARNLCRGWHSAFPY